MKKFVGFVFLLGYSLVYGQVDTTFVYNPSTSYGSLDIRLAKSATRYYYLQESTTFSFRESAPGVKTNTFTDMTSWDSSPYSEGHLREKNGSASYFVMNYRLLFPVNYTTTYTEGYPLIIMLHGAGERGNCWDTNCYWATRGYNGNSNNPPAPTTSNHPLYNNDHNLTHGGAPHLSARNLAAGKLPNDPTLNPRAFPGFVLFPQNINGWDSFTISDAIRMLRLIIKKYNVDPNRIYVHGLSNGGSGTYEAIKRAPWLFAAALPMSAVTDASILAKGAAPKVVNVPIWAFQGGKDTSPSPAKTNGYLKGFRNAGANVRYSLYPNLGHGTWNTAYSEPDFFSWMLSNNKSKIHVFYNNPAICGTTGQGVKLGLAFGFLAYQWEKDGQIISGADSSEFVANEPGVYRARFSRKSTNPTENQWNKWSDPVTVTLSNPAQAVITTIGTTHMRGPDNNSFYNRVYLKSVNTSDAYFWYKNGVLINIPNTTLDDTTRTYSITSTSNLANGVFTLVNKGIDNCPSPVSEPLNVFFVNSAPLVADNNIPSNFQGSALSASSITLSWNDNSTIETAYEIWRKKPGGFFLLAGKTAPDQTGFVDTGLEPSIAYQYKIRAITALERSNYAPSNNVNTNLVITTLADNVLPTTPQNLAVLSNTINSITLSWTGSTDNTDIKQYHIYYGANLVMTASKKTTHTLTGLTANTAYNLYVVAEDLGGNLSASSNVVAGSTYVSGLIYGHSTGAWSDLDEITNWNSPEFTGSVPNFTLSPRTQEDFFYFEYKGYLYITTGGNYEFRTTSDDGSRLLLNNAIIVDNDGLHGNVTVTSAVQILAAGPQDINVRYFEYTGGQSLTVQYRGPDTGNNWVTIPDGALKSASTPPSPASIAAKNQSASARISTEEIPLVEASLVLNMYPNPSASDNISIQLETSSDEPVQVRLLDMMGKSHYYNAFSRDEINSGIKIKPAGLLNNGMYVIIINQGKLALKEKLIIKN